MKADTDRQTELCRELEQLGLPDCYFDPPGGKQTEPALFILNYRKDNGSYANFALPMGGFCDGGNNFIKNTCWISEQKVKRIGADELNPYPDYHERQFKGRSFYPFSVALGEEKCDAKSILQLISRIYNHLDFQSE